MLRTIVVLWKEWERVSEASSKNHSFYSRQDLDIESVVETHSKEARDNSQYRSSAPRGQIEWETLPV